MDSGWDDAELRAEVKALRRRVTHGSAPSAALGQSGMALSALRASVPGSCLRTIGDVLECPKGSHSTQRP